jgi:hypothetical protein
VFLDGAPADAELLGDAGYATPFVYSVAAASLLVADRAVGLDRFLHS